MIRRLKIFCEELADMKTFSKNTLQFRPGILFLLAPVIYV